MIILFILLSSILTGPQASFILDNYGLASTVEAKYNVPAELVLAQASLETGFGSSYSARVRNNYFGITFSTGLVKFDDKSQSFQYYGSLMERKYGHCLQLETEEMVECIAEKYAEDPNYSKKVLSVIKRIKQITEP